MKHQALFLLTSIALTLNACGAATEQHQVVNKPPPDPLKTAKAQALYDQGVSLAKDGDYIRAEQYLSAAHERGYPDEKVVPKLIHVCLRASRFYAGLKYARPFLDRHPRDWHLRFVVATLYQSLENYSMAKREFERVTLDAPEFANAHFSLAMLQRDHLKNNDAARAHFDRYLALAPRGEHAEEALMALDEMKEGDTPQAALSQTSAPPVKQPAQPIPTRLSNKKAKKEGSL